MKKCPFCGKSPSIIFVDSRENRVTCMNNNCPISKRVMMMNRWEERYVEKIITEREQPESNIPF